MSDSLQPHGLQHTRLLCPPLSPRVCSDSCLLSQWCYLTISFSAAPFSFCLQSFPATGSFPSELVLCIRRPRYWSFSFSISPFNEYSGLFSYRIDCFDLLTVQGTLKSLLQHHNSKTSILCCSTFFMIQLSQWLLEKTKVLTIRTFVGNVMSLLFNMLSRFVLAFLPRNKCLFISWLQSPSTVILEPKKIKSVAISIVSPSIYHEVMGLGVMIFVFFFFFLMLSFKSDFSLSYFTVIKRLFSSSSPLPLEWYYLHIWICWYFSQQSWFQLVIHLVLHFVLCTLHIS